jgi:DNA (cytosine-5)-methyltransferase 1
MISPSAPASKPPPSPGTRSASFRVGFSEIDRFPSAVLAHHYPQVPNHGDFTSIGAPAIDLLVGGTPCQSFSVAGLRGGLADGRGNLALEFMRLAARCAPRWIVWENVPGVLSSNGGRDFGAILGALVELGYGFAYRVLDAQFFGVPQRRRRVFIVGHLGDWRRAAAVLFERESLRGNPPASGEARKEVAGTLGWASDSARYKAVGNSMAVPCMRWLGERIEAVDALEAA